MKKKFLTISLVVILLAMAVAGGTLAWFTDSDEVTNVFTIGSVEIVQHEKNADGTDFTQNQYLLPIVNTADPAADNNYVDKIVTVENTGKNPAYIRTYIAIPKALLGVLCIDTKEENWTYVNMGAASIGGVDYVVYYYDYDYTLVPGETTDKLLKGVYLDSKTDLNVYYDAQGNVTHAYFVGGDGKEITSIDASQSVHVYVATRAVQAEGFEGQTIAQVMQSVLGNTMPEFVAVP